MSRSSRALSMDSTCTATTRHSSRPCRVGDTKQFLSFSPWVTLHFTELGFETWEPHSEQFFTEVKGDTCSHPSYGIPLVIMSTGSVFPNTSLARGLVSAGRVSSLKGGQTVGTQTSMDELIRFISCHSLLGTRKQGLVGGSRPLGTCF